MTMVQGTCVEIDGIAVLLRGPSGSGKSDLALRMIDSGARLVADDIVNLRVSDGAVIAAPPPAAPLALRGRMEVRGLGIVAVASVPEAELGLVVDLVAPALVERLPEPRYESLLGVDLPRLGLAPFEASAPVKLRLAVAAARRGALGTL